MEEIGVHGSHGNHNSFVGETDEVAGEKTDLASPRVDPFFTVVEDTISGEHHHPHVEYIFSDDDPDRLTSAVLHSLDTDSHHTRAERLLIIDLDTSGRAIASAKSLSPDWQISNVRLGPAPTFGNAHTSAAGEASLMLRLEGADSAAHEAGARDGHTSALMQPRRRSGEGHAQELHAHLESLSSQYAKGMEELKRWSKGGDRC